MKLKLFLILQLLFLPLILTRVHFHVSDIESYINNLSHSDRNHDYNRDGKTQTTKHGGHLTKVLAMKLFKPAPFKITLAPILIGQVVFQNPKIIFTDAPLLLLLRPPVQLS